MFDAKATDNSIDKSDDKNDEENDVVQNICSGLRFRVIDVHPTDDEEEEANDHLILNVFGIIIIITRPKLAYGRQGLDWIVGPVHSSHEYFLMYSQCLALRRSARIEVSWIPQSMT